MDIYLPDLKFAIEFNGLYWHKNSLSKTHEYKSNLCKKLEVQLFHIYEDDWNENPQFIKNNLKNYIYFLINKNNQSEINIEDLSCKLEWNCFKINNLNVLNFIFYKKSNKFVFSNLHLNSENSIYFIHYIKIFLNFLKYKFKDKLSFEFVNLKSNLFPLLLEQVSSEYQLSKLDIAPQKFSILNHKKVKFYKKTSLNYIITEGFYKFVYKPFN